MLVSACEVIICLHQIDSVWLACVTLVIFVEFADIDECKMGNGGCEQTCINTLGAFYCECEEGFERVKGFMCESMWGKLPFSENTKVNSCRVTMGHRISSRGGAPSPDLGTFGMLRSKRTIRTSEWERVIFWAGGRGARQFTA